ncbi:Uncharacterised protein [Segatella copri]|nr:Uncharacterised protein [Segatella copri]
MLHTERQNNINKNIFFIFFLFYLFSITLPVSYDERSSHKSK